MKGLHLLVGLGVALCAVGAAACGGDEDGAGGSTSTGPGSGGAGGGTTTTTTTTGGGGGAGGGGGGSGGAGGGVSIACDPIPMGPFNATEVLSGLNGSEDFAFDGKGSIAARQGNQVVLVDAAGTVTPFADNTPNTLGLRYRGDGNLAAAVPGQGTIRTISPTGVMADLVTGLNGPNGVYPDAAGNVWVTEFGGDRVIRVNPDQSVTTIVNSQPDAVDPNGIVYDAGRELLFYTNYGAGEIMRVDMAAGGDMTPALVATIQGALDGLVLDACGNLYVVDNGDDELYRVRLDAGGAMVGDPELLASFPQSVANAQFGAGTGFEAETLYVGGQAGRIYAVPVGVPGAPVPTPP